MQASPEVNNLRISYFTSLSEVDKASVSVTYDNLSNDIRKEIIAIQASLRPGEGLAFKRVVERYKSLVQPATTASKGVFTPFDAMHHSNSEIEIWLPEDMETHADSILQIETLRYAAHVPGVKVSRARGEVPHSEPGNWFIMGYMTELLSRQPIKQIKYSKDSPYMLGRACARVKLVLASIDQSKIPTKYLQIPDRFLGGIANWKEPEITRALRSYYTAEDAKHVERLLQILSTHLIRVSRQEIRDKVDDSLFKPIENVINMTKRHITITERTQKGRPKAVSKAVTPTKPSLLATVAPWERNAISELYERSWDDEKYLVDGFRKLHPLDRDYNSFGKKLSEVINEQWGSKQKVLRQTSHRLAGYPGDQNDPLYKKLNWCRETLRKWNNIESLPQDLYPEFDPVALIPGGNTFENKKMLSFVELILSPDGKDRYPKTRQLIDEFRDKTNAIGQSLTGAS
jgi:hypothetical protein